MSFLTDEQWIYMMECAKDINQLPRSEFLKILDDVAGKIDMGVGHHVRIALKEKGL
jgi:hypothetical protein